MIEKSPLDSGETLQTFQPPLSTSFSFCEWQVDPALNKLFPLSGNKDERAIEPRLMHLLCFLAANQGQVINRETLVEQLWPRVIVNENSLTRAVSELRKQLRSEQNLGCKAIETIPKRGYRLDAAVRAIDLQRQECATAATPFEIAHSSVSLLAKSDITRRFGLAAAFALLIASTLSISPMDQSYPVKETFLADELISEGFSLQRGQVTLSTATSDEPINFETTTPVVSFDGTHYAFLKYDQTGSTIFMGNVEKMSDPLAIFHHQDRLLNLGWSPLGKSLLFARKPSLTTAALFTPSAEDTELLVLDIATREVRRLIEDEPAPNNDVVHESKLT